ncbi:hypothetical protein [uncultured Anoxybacillus sp.]|uniref:hypothetical protein n=1 Tax=uncultured Anoxybacillus sp. TaxID=263860 RepID=UPI0026230A39|nr:hypothetical protein [uncultured Anoxybacillus sp.]
MRTSYATTPSVGRSNVFSVKLVVSIFLFPTIVHGEQGATVDDFTLTPENYEKWLKLAEQKDMEHIGKR